jgi:site-specific DNA-cytosine methylase
MNWYLRSLVTMTWSSVAHRANPFSDLGKARAAPKDRDMFPDAIEVMRTQRPRAFLIENVRGLTCEAFANHHQYILLRLTHPRDREQNR